MALRDKINSDFKEAFKARDEVKISVLRMLLAGIKNKEVEKRTKLSKSGTVENLDQLSELTDEEMIEVVSSEIKKRREAAETFSRGGREELAKKEQLEVEVLSFYMPRQLDEQELVVIIQEAIKSTGAEGLKDLGKVMGAIMPQVKGKADGSLVTKIVKDKLGVYGHA